MTEKPVALPSSPTHNHQNVLDCGIGCPAGPIATWPKYQGESVPSTPSPTNRVVKFDVQFANGFVSSCENDNADIYFRCLVEGYENARKLGVPSTPVETSNWPALVTELNRLHMLLRDKPKSEQLGHRREAGSILNAYREGDMTFEEAVKELNELPKATPVETSEKVEDC